MLVTVIFFLSSSCFLSVNKLISFCNRVIEWFASEGTFKDHSVQPRLSGPTLWSVLISLVTCFSFNFFLSFLVFFLSLPFGHFPTWSLLWLLFPTLHREAMVIEVLMETPKSGAHGSTETWEKNSLRKITVIIQPVGNIG